MLTHFLGPFVAFASASCRAIASFTSKSANSSKLIVGGATPPPNTWAFIVSRLFKK